MTQSLLWVKQEGLVFYSECPAGRADEVQTPAGPLHKGRALMFFIARVGEEEEEEEEVGTKDARRSAAMNEAQS